MEYPFHLNFLKTVLHTHLRFRFTNMLHVTIDRVAWWPLPYPLCFFLAPSGYPNALYKGLTFTYLHTNKRLLQCKALPAPLVPIMVNCLAQEHKRQWTRIDWNLNCEPFYHWKTHIPPVICRRFSVVCRNVLRVPANAWIQPGFNGLLHINHMGGAEDWSLPAFCLHLTGQKHACLPMSLVLIVQYGFQGFDPPSSMAAPADLLSLNVGESGYRRWIAGWTSDCDHSTLTNLIVTKYYCDSYHTFLNDGAMLWISLTHEPDGNSWHTVLHLTVIQTHCFIILD